jgi:molybdate transport system substrate-binding protein
VPRLSFTFALTLLSIAACPVQASNPKPEKPVTLTVYTAEGISQAARKAAIEYEKAAGVKLNVTDVPPFNRIPQAARSNPSRSEPVDIVLTNRNTMDRWVAQGNVDKASRVEVGKSFIAMAVREGAETPDISDMENFRRTLLNALSVAYSDTASGMYLTHWVFPNMKLSKPLKARLVSDQAVGEAVANGDAEVGLQQMSELTHVPGIKVIGLIPDQVQQMTLYSAAAVKGSSHPEETRGFLQYLVSPAARTVIKDGGLIPVH